MDYFGLGTNVGAAVSAGAELWEDFEHVGHHHGLALLMGSKMCREINVMREAVKDGVKDAVGTVCAARRTRRQKLMRPCLFLLDVLTHNAVALFLAIGALAAAFVEVLEDITPGGEHGAVLLAINELLELLEHAHVIHGRALTFLSNCYFRLTLSIGAFAFALYETVETMSHGKFGAHHGIAVLALMKTLRTAGILRSRFKNYGKKKKAKKA
jgi:hypothetical protein